MTAAGIERIADELMFTSEMALVLFNSSPDAIVVVDTSGVIRMVNTQAELLFGYHHSEMREQPVEILLPEELRQTHEGHRQHFLDDPRVRPMGIDLSLQARRKDGTKVAVDINLSPVVTPRGTFVIATVRRKRAQAA